MTRPTSPRIGNSRRGPHVVGILRRGPYVAVRALCTAFVLVVALSVHASAQQSAAKQKAQAGVRWDDDSIRFGDSVRIDPRVRVQADVLLWNSEDPIEDRFSWGSRRIGVNGELFNRVQFQVERAFQDDDDDDSPWRDVYADVRINRAFQVRGGRFKLPFSLERNTS